MSSNAKNTPREPSEAGTHAASSYRIIIFGLGRFGTAIGLRLHKRGIRVLGVGFQPASGAAAGAILGLRPIFGDASDPEFVTETAVSGRSVGPTVPIHPTGQATKTPAGH